MSDQLPPGNPAHRSSRETINSIHCKVSSDMGQIREHQPVLLLLAVISRYASARQFARGKAEAAFGAIVLESEAFPFTETNYYEDTMGRDLTKTFLVFERLIDPAELVDIKHETNRWEEAYAEHSHHPESRPLNLDPGYLSEAKLVLASTKDRDHRIYLDRGIYAECTLFFQRGQWRAREWTYPDYRREDYHQFFDRCRDYLRDRYHKRPLNDGA